MTAAYACQPDEHKLAVYTPLFAPIAVPMIVGLLKELLAWWRRRKGKKARIGIPDKLAISKEEGVVESGGRAGTRAVEDEKEQEKEELNESSERTGKAAVER